MKGLEQQGLWDLSLEMCRYGEAIGRMEDNGILIDVDFVKEAIINCNEKQSELEAEIYNKAGQEFNLNSPAQVCKFLQIPSSNRQALEDSTHPIAMLLNDFRKYGRARDTYYIPFLECLDPNNRLHPDIELLTAAGRASIKRPALQTLPRESAIYNVRGAVISPPGKTLVDCDESQIELRLLAHMSQDPNLIYAYNNGIDVHTQTAEMLNIPRQVAKRVNFSVVYGAGIVGLINSLRMEGIKLIQLLGTLDDSIWQEAERTGYALSKNMRRKKDEVYPEWGTEEGRLYWTELGASKNILDDYNKRFPAVKAWVDKTIAFAERNRYVKMWTGRVRRFPNMTLKDGRTYSKAYSAPNPVIQGGANEVLRIAITNMDAEFQAYGPEAPTLHLAVHDSVILEINDNALDFWIPKILSHMALEKVVRFAVPLKADAKYGARWNTLVPWDMEFNGQPLRKLSVSVLKEKQEFFVKNPKSFKDELKAVEAELSYRAEKGIP
jgi:DNA polymerase-1